MKNNSTELTVKKILRIISVTSGIISAVSTFVLMYMYLGDIVDYLKEAKGKWSKKLDERREKKQQIKELKQQL